MDLFNVPGQARATIHLPVHILQRNAVPALYREEIIGDKEELPNTISVSRWICCKVRITLCIELATSNSLIVWP